MKPPGHRAGERPHLTRYLLVVAGVLIAFVLAFLLTEAFAVPLLDRPERLLAGSGVLAAVVGVGLLVADVVLPVPSSLVMVAHGALFGAALGATISLVGAVGAALAGYGLGRWVGPPVLRRVCSAAERERAAHLVRRWGLLAVVASRPVPLLAETVALIAGTEQLGVLRTVAGSVVGALPGAVLFAAAGSLGRTGPSGLAVLVVVLAATALLWAFGTAGPGRNGDGRDRPQLS